MHIQLNSSNPCFAVESLSGNFASEATRSAQRNGGRSHSLRVSVPCDTKATSVP